MARSSKSAVWPTRNKFKEADSTDPERVLAAKAWVRKLYDVEDEAKAIIAAEKLTGAEAAAIRLRLRKEKAVPLLTSLRQWLVEQKEQVLPKNNQLIRPMPISFSVRSLMLLSMCRSPSVV